MTAKSTDPRITDLVMGILAGYVRDVNLDGAAGKSGRIFVTLEVCLDQGEVPWSKGAAWFEQRRNYSEDK
jgi:hypothetical protein